MCKPQISQAPPETKRELFRKICGCHDTRLNGFEEYSKIKKRCIWCCYIAIIIYKWVISWSMITVEITLEASNLIFTGSMPACCLSFDRKEVPKGTQYLKVKDHQVNKRSVDCAYQKHFYRRITMNLNIQLYLTCNDI